MAPSTTLTRGAKLPTLAELQAEASAAGSDVRLAEACVTGRGLYFAFFPGTGMLVPLTPCCGASGKGSSDSPTGVICRSCHGAVQEVMGGAVVLDPDAYDAEWDDQWYGAHDMIETTIAARVFSPCPDPSHCAYEVLEELGLSWSRTNPEDEYNAAWDDDDRLRDWREER